MSSITKWETYQGGSAEAENKLFTRLAGDIMDVQLANKKRAGAPQIQRAFHAKGVLGAADAVLRISGTIPKAFQVGYIKPNAEYETTVRFSNADGTRQADSARDLRGVALRVTVSDSEVHDLLMTNFPVPHARDATEFVTFAKLKATSPGLLILVPRMWWHLGWAVTIRMLDNLKKAARSVESLALETYWSRGAILWGSAGPVRFQLRPAGNAPTAPTESQTNNDYLRDELINRLRKSELRFELFIQPFVDEVRTPVENAATEWKESDSPRIQIATLTIPQQNVGPSERQIDEMAFNPWNTTEEFRPLGNLNRARKQAYAASAAHRLRYRFREHKPLRNIIFGSIGAAILEVVNKFVPWHRLPWTVGLANLSFFREELREKNLLDTEPPDAPPTAVPKLEPITEELRTARTYDGTYNDLSEPNMGSENSTFGRNMQPIYRPDDFDRPNPIDVSRELMTRKELIRAETLNVIAASWIQFQVHDWVSHRRYDLGSGHDIAIPLPDGGTWQSHVGGDSEKVMRIADNDVSHKSSSGYPVFRNATTPWWDGSEVYGTTKDKAMSLRDGAHIRLEGRYLPRLKGMEVTGFNDSWWLGLSMMHTLFANEHNAICDALENRYKDWPPERVYQTARLIISALIAKIHTIEWTPGILATRTLQAAMETNWHGAPKDWLTQLGLWLLDTHALKGIPQSLPDHHGAPYSLTEEFVSVYRMHPLIPDDYHFFDFKTGKATENLGFLRIQGEETDDVLRRLELHNVVYSLGIANPGAITLHNFPESLRKFKRRNRRRAPGSTEEEISSIEEIIDLSVVDLVRDRRRGVPRYNDFRAALHRPRVRHWEELSDDRDTVKKMRELYGSIDMVDTMVGLHAETPPKGFGFSDTAFRIFILMASRRIQSDRFLTADFRPEVYSELGLDWIENNGMTSIILRHCPELASVLPKTANAFAPFTPLEKAR